MQTDTNDVQFVFVLSSWDPRFWGHVHNWMSLAASLSLSLSMSFAVRLCLSLREKEGEGDQWRKNVVERERERERESSTIGHRPVQSLPRTRGRLARRPVQAMSFQRVGDQGGVSDHTAPRLSGEGYPSSLPSLCAVISQAQCWQVAR